MAFSSSITTLLFKGSCNLESEIAWNLYPPSLFFKGSSVTTLNLIGLDANLSTKLSLMFGFF